MNNAGTRIAVASRDKALRVWDALSAKELARVVPHRAKVGILLFSQDGNSLLTGASNMDVNLSDPDYELKLWDANTLKEIRGFRGHVGDTVAAAWSPDGTMLLTASADNTARLWDSGSGKPVAVLGGHTNWLTHAAFAPDGLWVATSSNDGTARMWTTAGATQAVRVEASTDRLYHAQFGRDGTTFLTAGGAGIYPEYDDYYSPKDETVGLWDTASGQRISTLKGH
jgi:WD40 repeat protein